MAKADLEQADSPDELGLDGARLARLGERLQADVDRGLLPGAVVLLARHGRIAWHECFGCESQGAHRSPMRRHTLFRIAAMSRPLIAVLALSLAEQGELALADPVQHYLPEFASVQVGLEQVGADGQRQLVRVPPRRAMTVHDLLRHSSGLTYGMFGDSLVQRLYRAAGVMDPAQTNAELVHKLAALPLQCDPGSTFEYGMSTDLLGCVIEAATGRDLESCLATHVTHPLAMHDTGFCVAPRDGAGLARAREGIGLPASPMFDYDPADPPIWRSAGAGLLGTAGDYARLCQMLLDGGTLAGQPVLSRHSVALMLANHLPDGIAFGASTPSLGINAPMPELGQGHGLGVGVRLRDGLSPVPGSVGDFFWGGVLGTYFWADPRERLVAVLMLQENDAVQRARYRALLRHAVYGALLDRGARGSLRELDTP
jgi:CubicO group peptidase (beta-lactamase class C family)